MDAEFARKTRDQIEEKAFEVSIESDETGFFGFLSCPSWANREWLYCNVQDGPKKHFYFGCVTSISSVGAVTVRMSRTI
jgi:hypothetical protein